MPDDLSKQFAEWLEESEWPGFTDRAVRLFRPLVACAMAAERAEMFYPHGVNPDLDKAMNDIHTALANLREEAGNG